MTCQLEYVLWADFVGGSFVVIVRIGRIFELGCHEGIVGLGG